MKHFDNMPPQIAALPRDHRGFPVPWFVGWVDGKPVFPRMDPVKLQVAVQRKRCWVCGEPLGRFMAFVIGPMCTINRISAEPPSHRDCATFSARVCPFLANPSMRRVPMDENEKRAVAGTMIDRNPGCCAVWTTRSYQLVRAHNGVLFQIGHPTDVEWFAEGRTATRAEVMASVESGLPILRQAAEADGPEAVGMLEQMRGTALRYLPAA